MANVKHVAALAGVSSATVSRALSSPERLRPETLKRVEDAIARLDYMPLESARSLRSGRTRTVGIIAPTLMNELYAKAVDSLERQFETLDYTVLLTCHRDNAETELQCARTLLGRGVEALAMIGSQHHPDLFPLIRKQNVPYADVDHRPQRQSTRRSATTTGSHAPLDRRRPRSPRVRGAAGPAGDPSVVGATPGRCEGCCSKLAPDCGAPILPTPTT
jgi:DNA-binding LacI/PurR family transcriptional regulator